MDLLPQEMVQEFASWFVMDKNKGGVGKTPVTKAELQAELDSLTTKQIVAKLVKIRRDNVLSCPKLSWAGMSCPKMSRQAVLSWYDLV